jgi:hypothetical protein
MQRELDINNPNTWGGEWVADRNFRRSLGRPVMLKTHTDSATGIIREWRRFASEDHRGVLSSVQYIKDTLPRGLVTREIYVSKSPHHSIQEVTLQDNRPKKSFTSKSVRVRLGRDEDFQPVDIMEIELGLRGYFSLFAVTYQDFLLDSAQLHHRPHPPIDDLRREIISRSPGENLADLIQLVQTQGFRAIDTPSASPLASESDASVQIPRMIAQTGVSRLGEKISPSDLSFISEHYVRYMELFFRDAVNILTHQRGVRDVSDQVLEDVFRPLNYRLFANIPEGFSSFDPERKSQTILDTLVKLIYDPVMRQHLRLATASDYYLNIWRDIFLGAMTYHCNGLGIRRSGIGLTEKEDKYPVLSSREGILDYEGYKFTTNRVDEKRRLKRSDFGEAAPELSQAIQSLVRKFKFTLDESGEAQVEYRFPFGEHLKRAVFLHMVEINNPSASATTGKIIFPNTQSILIPLLATTSELTGWEKALDMVGTSANLHIAEK